MYFDSWSDFFAMGGHGPYVWSAYGIAFVVIIWNLLAPVITHKRAIARIQRLERIKQNQNYQATSEAAPESQG